MMEHVLDNGVKLIIPDGKMVHIICNTNIDGEKEACGVQHGNALYLMALTTAQIEEIMKKLPEAMKKQFIVTVAEILENEARKVDGLDVVMMKMRRKEDSDEEDI